MLTKFITVLSKTTEFSFTFLLFCLLICIPIKAGIYQDDAFHEQGEDIIGDSFNVSNDKDFEIIKEAYHGSFSPEDDLLFKECFGENAEIIPIFKVYQCSMIWDIYGYGLDDIQHTLKRASKTVYAIGVNTDDYYNKYPFFYAYRNPASQLVYSVDLDGLTTRHFVDFENNFDEIFNSTKTTAQLDNPELIKAYFIIDEWERVIIYCHTNYGNYIYCNLFTSKDLCFLFPIEDFITALHSVENRKDRSFFHSQNFVNETLFECIPLDTIISYVVGGEEALKEEYPNYATLYTPNSPLAEQPTDTPTESLPSATETEPLEIDVAKPFDVFNLLFFVETAVVVVGAVIFTVICFKKKRIKQ